MLKLDPPSVPIVYQLRGVLRGVSPLIWRRLLVGADCSVAELHTALQIAFSWSGEHLHRFVIHGREYGIAYLGGPSFRDDARRVPLARFGFRVGERFAYEYDFYDAWCHDLRVERVLSAEEGRAYPRCIGGRRASPPEDCGGPWRFLELRQQHSVLKVAWRLAEIFKHPEDLDEHRGELLELHRWLTLERFNRRAVNRQLARRFAIQEGAA